MCSTSAAVVVVVVAVCRHLILHMSSSCRLLAAPHSPQVLLSTAGILSAGPALLFNPSRSVSSGRRDNRQVTRRKLLKCKRISCIPRQPTNQPLMSYIRYLVLQTIGDYSCRVVSPTTSFMGWLWVGGSNFNYSPNKFPAEERYLGGLCFLYPRNKLNTNRCSTYSNRTMLWLSIYTVFSGSGPALCSCYIYRLK